MHIGDVVDPTQDSDNDAAVALVPNGTGTNRAPTAPTTGVSGSESILDKARKTSNGRVQRRRRRRSCARTSFGRRSTPRVSDFLASSLGDLEIKSETKLETGTKPATETKPTT